MSADNVSYTFGMEEGSSPWKSWFFPSLFAVFALLMLCCICFSCCAAHSEARSSESTQLKRINKEARRATAQQAGTTAIDRLDPAVRVNNAPGGPSVPPYSNPVQGRLVYQTMPPATANGTAYPGMGCPAYRPSDVNDFAGRMRPPVQQYPSYAAVANPYGYTTQQCYYQPVPPVQQPFVQPTQQQPVPVVAPSPAAELKPATTTASSQSPTIVIQVPDRPAVPQQPSQQLPPVRAPESSGINVAETLDSEKRKNAELQDRIRWLEKVVECQAVSKS